MPKIRPQGLRIENAAGDPPKLFLYDEIGPSYWGLIGADSVLEALADIGDVQEIAVHINSPGGDVFEGVAIYNALARHTAKIRIEVDGLAASIASVIAMAGDEIVIAGNGMLMIHQAWTMAWGNADELTKVVTSLRKVDGTIIDTYDARTGESSTRDQISEWMLAETWMDATEAVDRGFADRKGDLKGGVEASIAEGRYRNTPKHLVAVGRPAAPPRRDRVQPVPDDDRPTADSRRASYVPTIAARLAAVRARQ